MCLMMWLHSLLLVCSIIWLGTKLQNILLLGNRFEIFYFQMDDETKKRSNLGMKSN